MMEVIVLLISAIPLSDVSPSRLTVPHVLMGMNAPLPTPVAMEHVSVGHWLSVMI